MVKRVLIVIKHLIYGGTEKYTLNLVNSLAEKGVSVILVTGGGSLSRHISPKVKIFFTPISRKLRIRQISERRILEIAQFYKPQIIHAQCRTSLICSQLARKSLNIPVLTHEHHMYDDVDYPYIVDELKNSADMVATIGPYTSKKLIKYGLEKDNVVTILNGVDVSLPPIDETERLEARRIFSLSKLDKVVVCLSRVVTGKGIDKLALGFAKVVNEIPEAKLIIAGDDDENIYLPVLREIVKVNRLEKKVLIYPGEYDIRKFHAVADVFCYPALGKGMAVMEAMAAGLPVVGKKTIKKPLVMEDNISGLMTEETSEFSIAPDQIAEKLIYLLSNPVIARKMGQVARKRIEKKFNLESMVLKVLGVYSEVNYRHQLHFQKFKYKRIQKFFI